MSPRGGKSVLMQHQRKARALNTGILFVSKQLRAEGIKPYLQNTEFTFRSEKEAFAWLRTVPEHYRKFLKHVRLELTSEVELAEIASIEDQVWVQRKVKRLNSRSLRRAAAMGDGVFGQLGMPAGFRFEVQSYRYSRETKSERPRIEYSW